MPTQESLLCQIADKLPDQRDNDDLEIVEVLLPYESEPNILEAFKLAAKHGHENLVIALLQTKVVALNLNAKKSAFIMAMRRQDENIVKILQEDEPAFCIDRLPPDDLCSIIQEFLTTGYLTSILKYNLLNYIPLNSNSQNELQKMSKIIQRKRLLGIIGKYATEIYTSLLLDDKKSTPKLRGDVKHYMLVNLKRINQHYLNVKSSLKKEETLTKQQIMFVLMYRNKDFFVATMSLPGFSVDIANNIAKFLLGINIDSSNDFKSLPLSFSSGASQCSSSSSAPAPADEYVDQWQQEIIKNAREFEISLEYGVQQQRKLEERSVTSSSSQKMYMP